MAETEEEKKAREAKEAQAKEVNVATLQEKIKGMEGMLEEGKTAKDQLLKELKESKDMLYSPEFIDFMDKKEKESGGKGSSKEGGDTDLTTMSRAELVAHTQEGMTQVLVDAAKKWDEELKVMREDHFKLTKMADVEFMKLRDPEFSKWLATEDGKEEFLKIADGNKEWGSQKIFDDKKKQDLVTAKEKADQEAEQAKEEKEVWSEKPGKAASIAEEKDLSDEDIAGRAYDATFGNLDQEAGVEEPAGVIHPIKEK